MSKRMLIDSSHPEETRVVVLSGNRLEEFDYEAATKKQLKGNIYLAKITRVEPSLQAAFVDYGGNRHGFLPFSEIHPDYYRIPIADREALIEEQAAAVEAADEEQEREPEIALAAAEFGGAEISTPAESDGDDSAEEYDSEAAGVGPLPDEALLASDYEGDSGEQEEQAEDSEPPAGAEPAPLAEGKGSEPGEVEEIAVETKIDTVGGEEVEEEARRRARLMRRYKIQEVIKRRQVILVQVTKEERGTKGAALTTYLSLAGRYCVLMPNTGKGGGISRKISSAADRRRLKQVIGDLEIPEGMAVIVRTAGSQRSKAEIRRDYDYLIKLWSDIRDNTLKSTAPALIYEEASLIKRSIRDLYTRDMDEILVEGEEGYKQAKDFMKSLIPSHARKVQLYKDPAVPLFVQYRIEDQLDAMHGATLQLRSGGSLVLNQTEALVAIDVNSGKATRERHIEETALKTNLEAADEIARQLRLRDLAGLIVIDFIDMEDARHNREVERRFKDAMRHDRARIQLGRISPFGLLEMSRQRLRPSLSESSTVLCPHCHGSGRVRSIDSAALHILRAIQDEGIKRRGGTLKVTLPGAVALYLINQKRDRLQEMELLYELKVEFAIDDTLVPPNHRLERRDAQPRDQRELREQRAEPRETVEAAEGEEERGEQRRGRRRRGRRGHGEREERREGPRPLAAAPEEAEFEEHEEAGDEEGLQAEERRPEEQRGEMQREGERRGRRRRGRRGGRRRREAAEARARATQEAGHAEEAQPLEDQPQEEHEEEAAQSAQPLEERDQDRKRRRRGRRGRGGRGRDQAAGGEAQRAPESGQTQPYDEGAPHYAAESHAAEEPAPSVARHGNGSQEEPRRVEIVAERHEEPASQGETAVVEREPKSDEAQQPRRRGWWQRLTQ